jgi:hypothetical protein
VFCHQAARTRTRMGTSNLRGAVPVGDTPPFRSLGPRLGDAGQDWIEPSLAAELHCRPVRGGREGQPNRLRALIRMNDGPTRSTSGTARPSTQRDLSEST